MSDPVHNLLVIEGNQKEIEKLRKTLLYPDGNVEPELTFEYLIPIPEDLTYEEEQEWMDKNWGCYSPDDSIVLIDDPNILKISFETVYTPPFKVVEFLAKNFLDLKIELFCLFGAGGFSKIIFENEKLIEQDMEDENMSMQEINNMFGRTIFVLDS